MEEKIFTINLDLELHYSNYYLKPEYKVQAKDFNKALQKLCDHTGELDWKIKQMITQVTSELVVNSDVIN